MSASADGRLYRCDVTPTLSNGALVADDAAASEDDDWEEREASRTHSVKFTDAQEPDSREVSPENVDGVVKCPAWYRLMDCVVRRGLRPGESYYVLNSAGLDND